MSNLSHSSTISTDYEGNEESNKISAELRVLRQILRPFFLALYLH